MKVVVIDYNAGNTRSVINALSRLGIECELSDKAEVIKSADKVILPGVGKASSAMENLQSKNLIEVIQGLQQPILGVCLGMQLMCKYSEEGTTNCLGIFDTEVKLFIPNGGLDYKVPHMGWNTINDLSSPLFKGVSELSYQYFVHSYYVPLIKETIATCNYIQPFSAALQKSNFYGTQFHPEKGGSVGEQILKNFIEL